ncbi:hypothetical protein D6789_03365, partial [Candidatus Woesearchaeota archaeon]
MWKPITFEKTDGKTRIKIHLHSPPTQEKHAKPQPPTRKPKHKRRSVLHARRQLEAFLMKAGLEVTPKQVYKGIFFATLITVGLFTALTYIYGAIQGASPKNLLIFYSALWLVAFWAVYLFFLMAVYVYLDLRMYRRTQQLEEVLPDFLQLASANISAGMPVDRALWLAVRPNFGVLAKEIEEVARATLAGEELEQSL